MKDIQIIQYNCGNANHKAARPFFDAAAPARHQILAVQEPAYTPYNRATYCPKGYHLASTNTPLTRVCFMISNEIPISDWRFYPHSDYVASLAVRLEGEEVTIINVYNPRDNRTRIQTWPQIQDAINSAQGEIILLGDFNTHHPLWGGSHVVSEEQAERLLTDTAACGLGLITAQGVPTWRRNSSESVIDLTFGTEGIRQRVLRCGPVERWALTQDHIPIEIHTQYQRNEGVATATRPVYRLDKADWTRINQHIHRSGWEDAEVPLTALQEAIGTGLEKYCPVVRGGSYSNPRWSAQASELLAGARRARRRYNATGSHQDHTAMRSFQNLLQKELRRSGRAKWRRFISDSTDDSYSSNNKGLWKLARWSRRRAGEPPAMPHLPALRQSPQDQPSDENSRKAEILSEKFFPAPGEADLSDTADDTQPQRRLSCSADITKEELESVIKHLPTKKAPGPDSIANEALLRLNETTVGCLAKALSRSLTDGTIPPSLKESDTIVLRKERKQDYSLPSSYRPIALENTLAKLLEKIVADRLSQMAEDFNLLPWAQMGARRKRSTLSAIELLTTCAQTAWRGRRGGVLSMLCLDIKGAYDNVSHARLLWILRTKGLPDWMINIIQSFLTNRRTRLIFSGFRSDWINTTSGIPQGSPLSPILFLFFASELLENLQRSDSDTLAFGFIDDTNLISWGATASENCKRLEAAHDKCIAWAKRHGAQFAPEKYQLIHFTRRRRDPSGDLASSVRIENTNITPETTVKVLGVQVDSKLTWRPHVQQAALKGLNSYEALARLTAATWGPSVRHSRLLYTAVVRPTMLYGSQIWSLRGDGGAGAISLIQPLASAQAKSLRRITGAYKRTPIAAVEREIAVPPLHLYTDAGALQYAEMTRDYPVTKKITQTADSIWARLQRQEDAPPARRHRQRKPQERPLSSCEAARARAHAAREEAVTRHRHTISAYPRRQRQAGEEGGHRHRWKQKTAITKWMDQEWEKKWRQAAIGRTATTWLEPWQKQILRVYEGLPKHIATTLFLLRTEVIGLNAWLASVHVPGILPRCACGWEAQTVRHVMLFCPQYSHTRPALLRQAGTSDLKTLLSDTRCAQLAARWLVECGALKQFELAKEIEREDLDSYQAHRNLNSWN
jgi:endonuclease/exonuclease/phosphatase family metal-dependent hydrolase